MPSIELHPAAPHSHITQDSGSGNGLGDGAATFAEQHLLKGSNGKTQNYHIKEIGVATHQGKRPYQEDRYEIYNGFESGNPSEQYGYFAIYDGHVTDKFSDFAASGVLRRAIVESNQFKDCIYFSAVKEGFYHVEREMEKMADQDRSRGGTTAVVVMLTKEGYLLVGNVGDSRAVLAWKDIESSERVDLKTKPSGGHQFSLERLTKDHHPFGDERKRIEQSGGIVSEEGRVESDINMSRSMCDIQYKYPWNKLIYSKRADHDGDKITGDWISADPEITVHSLQTGALTILVLGSDGLWNEMSDEQVMQRVLVRYLVDDISANQICDELTRDIGSRPLSDNVTVVIVVIE